MRPRTSCAKRRLTFWASKIMIACLPTCASSGCGLFLQILIDTSSYFDYHHTPADTLDKVDPDHLRRHVAVMSATACSPTSRVTRS